MIRFITRPIAAFTSSMAFCLGAALTCMPPAQANADFDHHYELGKDFLQRQEYKLAIQELDIAAAKQASPVQMSAALVDRGTAYSELKKYGEAVRDFDRAITLDGKSHLAYNNLGVVYLRQGVADKAIANFDRALALDPEDKYAAVNRAGAYLMTDRPAALAPTSETWVKKHWQSDFAPQAATLTVLAYLLGGDKQHANALNQESLKRLDHLHWPYQMLAFMAGKCEAEKVVERAEDSTYELTQAQCYLGLHAYMRGSDGSSIARDKFEFVSRHGTTNSVEYWIGKFFLAKLVPPPPVKPPVKNGAAETKGKASAGKQPVPVGKQESPATKQETPATKGKTTGVRPGTSGH